MCMSILFCKFIDIVTPFFIKANTMIKSFSSIFTKKRTLQITNDTLLPGFMNHDPKKEAQLHHEKDI